GSPRGNDRERQFGRVEHERAPHGGECTRCRRYGRPSRRANHNVVIFGERGGVAAIDRKSTRLNSSHVEISYAVFCLKKKNIHIPFRHAQPRPEPPKPVLIFQKNIWNVAYETSRIMKSIPPDTSSSSVTYLIGCDDIT